MNITRLNTLNDDKVIVKKEGGNGGGDASTIEYVDISVINDTAKYNIVLFSILARVKLQDTIGVMPSGFTVEIEVPINNMLAVCMNTNMLILGQSRLITIKDSLIESGWWETYSSLPRITEEEFYHIPQDEIWTLNTQDDYKTAWDKLYPLVERYGADYINENRLWLISWYKSLALESEWGTVNLIEIVEYRSGLNGESNEDVIQFNGCALIKRYEDGGITYHLSIDEG